MIRLGEDAEVIFPQANLIVAKGCCTVVYEKMQPRSHGMYVPALERLGIVLKDMINHHPNTPTSVLFFSDGKPSDRPPKGKGESSGDKVLKNVLLHTALACIGQSASTFRFHTIGFGAADGDFKTLEAMAAMLNQSIGPGVAQFQKCGLKLHALTSALTSFSSSVTESILTVTPGEKVRQKRGVITSTVDTSWKRYSNVPAWAPPKTLGSRCLQNPHLFHIKISNTSFDSGGERNVFNFGFTNAAGIPNGDGKKWVAKRNKHVEADATQELDFHRRNLTTQYEAGELAKTFLAATKKLCKNELSLFVNLPSIVFNPCWLLHLDEYVFVEEKLEGKWTKWNSNSGYIAHKGKGVEYDVGSKAHSAKILAETFAKESNINTGGYIPTAEDVPQAFSHFTYHETNGGQLVCDLQGVFSSALNQYSMVDPVIHSRTKKKYGRTDRGADGVAAFFRSHKCNALCKMLGLPHNTPASDQIRQPEGTRTTSSPRNTSDITVVKTGHLQHRQDQRHIETRELQAAVKHGKKKKSTKRSGIGERIIHQHNDIEYITDKTGRIGITGYRK